MLVNLVENDVKKIQIDEGIVVLNFGKENQKIIGPTRGGSTTTISPSIRDIEFDGRVGKTKGLQTKDGEDAKTTITALCCSQEMLALALPGAAVGIDENKTIRQSKFGLIPNSAYADNLAIITRMLDGTFKALIIYNAMHEGDFNFKTQSKAENEHNLELQAHYDPYNVDEFTLWEIKDYATNPLSNETNSSEQENETNNSEQGGEG